MKEQQTLNIKKKSSNGGTIDIPYGFIKAASLVYLTLPVIIFFIGYLRAAWAVPTSIVAAAALVYGIKLSLEDKRKLTIKLSTLIILAVVALLTVYYCNIGEFVWGTTDHAFRRATLRDLIDYKWPVIYDLTKQSNPVVNSVLPDTTVGFAYYFSFWMVPAVVGKLAGFAAGNVTMLIWSFIGVLLTFIAMSGLSKSKAWPVIFSYICFSGLDVIPYFYNEAHPKQYWMWLEGWVEHMYYISNFNQLLNVYNQCIPVFLIVAVFMLSNDNRLAGFFGSLTFAYSPWATFGMIPVALYYLLNNKEDRTFKRILNPLNIITPVLMLIVFVPLFTANPAATSIAGPTAGFYDSIVKYILCYLLFIVIEIGPAALLTFKKFHKTAIYKIAVISLVLIPLYLVSPQNDFVMRASIPSLFVLCVLLSSTLADINIKEIPNAWDKKDILQKAKGVGTVILLAGMAYVWFQMSVTILASTYDGTPRCNEDIYSFGDVQKEDYLPLIAEQFYVYDYEDSFFFSHMAKEVG